MRECDHGEDLDDPGFACPPCQSQAVLLDSAPPVEQPRRSRAFPARFDGWCAECKRKILIDQMVQFNEDDEIVHTNCDMPEYG